MELKRRKKVMISQPMRGLTDDQIIQTKIKAVKKLESMGYEVVNSFFNTEYDSKDKLFNKGVIQIPIYFLHRSLEVMSLCDTMYFCKGWDKTNGCIIEHDVATRYGMEVLYEED